FQRFVQAAVAEGAGLDLVTQDLGQQVGGVDQSFLGALTHAGADFVHHRAQHEPAGQTDKEEVDQEYAHTERHGSGLRLVAVTETAMGLDRLFRGGDGTQLGAQALDMAVDIALVAGLAGHAKRVEQLLARIDPARLAKQRAQQAEFVAGQAQRLAVIVHAKGCIIDPERARRVDRRRFARRHTLEYGLDPRRHFARAEGLDHIVVGADFQPYHTVDFLAACGKEDHRHLGETPQALAHLEAADVGQADIENGQVEGAVLQQRQRLTAEARPVRDEAFGLQGIDQCVGNRGFVFDYEYLRHRASCTWVRPRQTAEGRDQRQAGEGFRLWQAAAYGISPRMYCSS